MGPVCHIGLTSALLAGAKLSGVTLSPEIVATTVAGGVFIDADKVFEIYHRNIKKQIPDITARDRILHSILGFPFAILLSYISYSPLPFIATLLHMAADSFIPGLKMNGRHYPSHSPWKWIIFPWWKDAWYKTVPSGWPIQYPPALNLGYKIAEPVGLLVTIVSVFVIFSL